MSKTLLHTNTLKRPNWHFDPYPTKLKSKKFKESASHHVNTMRFKSLSVSLEISTNFGPKTVICRRFGLYLVKIWSGSIIFLQIWTNLKDKKFFGLNSLDAYLRIWALCQNLDVKTDVKNTFAHKHVRTSESTFWPLPHQKEIKKIKRECFAPCP